MKKTLTLLFLFYAEVRYALQLRHLSSKIQSGYVTRKSRIVHLKNIHSKYTFISQKRIGFLNSYFKEFFANVPAEFTSYAPTFVRNSARKRLNRARDKILIHIGDQYERWTKKKCLNQSPMQSCRSYFTYYPTF